MKTTSKKRTLVWLTGALVLVMLCAAIVFCALKVTSRNLFQGLQNEALLNDNAYIARVERAGNAAVAAEGVVVQLALWSPFVLLVIYALLRAPLWRLLAATACTALALLVPELLFALFTRGISFGAGDFLLATGYAMLGALRWVWIGWLAYLAAELWVRRKAAHGS